MLRGSMDDGLVPVHGDGDDGEGGHEHVHGGQGGGQPAHGGPQLPPLQRVLHQRERHAHAAHEEVAAGQVEDVEVAGGAEVFASEENQDDQGVAQKAHGDHQAVGEDQSHHRVRGEPVSLKDGESYCVTDGEGKISGIRGTLL